MIYMHIAPEWGQSPADQQLGTQRFQNHKSSVHFPISFSNDILTIFPIEMHGRHVLTLPYKGQGHHGVIIHINFVELHAKFQNHMPSGAGEEYFKGLCNI